MHRGRPPLEAPPGPVTRIAGREVVYFGGTGYLGLQAHPEIIEAGARALREFGVHSATSRERFEAAPVLEVERRLCELFATEAALYTVSGYAGSSILVRALQGSFDRVFLDANTHYSVIDGADLAGCPVHRFASRDPEDLRRVLRAELRAGERPLVMIDGMFALWGTLAPLAELLDVLADFDRATLLVDDAHGVGGLGAHGRGTIEELGLWERGPNSGEAHPRLVFCATASKAIGGYGGMIVGSAAFVAQARAASHWYEGATPPPSAVAGSTAKAIEIVIAEPERRARLRANVRRVRAGLRALGIEVADLPSPVVGFCCGDAAAMRRIHEGLFEDGFVVPYAGVYSGAGSEGAMRLAVFATHTDAQIDGMLAALGKRL